MESTSTQPPPLRVVIVDDQDGFRRMLAMVFELEIDLHVVGEAADGIEAIEQAAELQPDLMLLDVSMPRMDGLDALPGIFRASPDTRVVMFSGFSNAEFKRRAVELGASSYVEKGVAPSLFMDALRAAARDRPDPNA